MIRYLFIIAFSIFFHNAYAQYHTLIKDDFYSDPAFNDLSKLLIWGTNNDYKSAFQIQDKTDKNGLTYNAIQLTDSAIKYADYHGPDNSTKGMTCLDWVFGPVIRNAHDTLKIEFDIYWNKISSSGERGRINAILLHDYPKGGPDTGDVVRFDIAHPFGRPAYHFRLRNRIGAAGKTGFIGYGGGDMEKGRLYRHDEYDPGTPDSLHWLPGAVPPSTTTDYYPAFPEEINQKDFYSEVASEDHWRHITWYVYPEKQTFYYKNSSESGDGSYFASMDLPVDPPADYPWFYHWFDTIEAFRIYFYGNGVNTYMANLKISATGSINTKSEPQKAHENHLTVYPNPFREHLTIRSNRRKIKRAILVNNTGKTVKEKAVRGKNCCISTQSLSRGLFFLKIITSDGSRVRKVVKQ